MSEEKIVLAKSEYTYDNGIKKIRRHRIVWGSVVGLSLALFITFYFFAG